MVRGIDPIRPIWGFNPQPGRIDVGNIQGADFSEAVGGMAKNFQQGFDWTAKTVGNREASKHLMDAANSSASPAATLLGMGAPGGPYGMQGGTGTDQVYQPQPFNSRSVPTFAAQGNAAPKSMPSGTFWSQENAQAIAEEAKAAGYSPEDLATVMSYETGGTMNPWQKGPTTKWGQHRGLIQWGEPQRQQYGVTPDMPFRDQVKASIKYLQDRGLKPGMGMLEMYSAINAGGISPEHFNRSDEKAGGAPGTVRDKVQNQMAAHRAKASAWLSKVNGQQDPQAVSAPAPGPQTVAQTQQPTGPLVPAAPTSIQAQAAQVLQAPDEYDPRTVEWAKANAGNQQPVQTAASPQLAPSPNDRQVAAEVTQNQIETVKAAAAPKPPTFMGVQLPPQQPGLAGGTGTDQIVGGGGTDAQGPAPQPQAPAPQPQAAPARPVAPYRPPVQQAPAQGPNPAVMRALAAAVHGGDPTAVSGVQSALSATSRGQGGRGNISLEQLPDGSTVLFNAETGEVSPYMQGSGVPQKAPTVQNINGVDHQWTGQGWQPLGTAQAKAPETKEVNGQLYQWDGADRQWKPALPQTPAGYRPASQEERTAYGAKEGQPMFIGPDGKPNFGPAGSSVSITNTPENKAEIKGSEEQAKRIDGMIGAWAEGGAKANAAAPQLGMLREVFNRTGPQGALADLKTAAGPYLEAAGISVAGLDDAQTVQAIVEQIATASRVPGSGAQSDIEYKGLLRSVPTLVQSPEARNDLLSVLEAKQAAAQARAEIAVLYDTNQIDRAEAIRRNAALPTEKSLFDAFRQKHAKLYAKGINDASKRGDDGDVSKLRNGGPVVDVPNEISARMLKAGTRFRLPDGRTGTVAED
jgi:hypothetical protein